AWNDVDAWGDAPTTSWRVEAEVDARVIVHGATHEKWVIVHAHVGGGCGTRSANVLGIYRQTTAGALLRMHQSSTGGIDHIDRLLDVDGDGRFEILSSSWMGPELELRTLDDASLDQRTVPFFGCPC
ncbi:MAG: hypothetical protein NT062_26070, partial [Proteobacteria bacterium]|nr:hypothetical protein [Pseudomonadota bacterium]